MYSVIYSNGLYKKQFKTYNEAVIYQNKRVNIGDISAKII